MKRLLHVCCANCLSDVRGALAADGAELVLLFANPNIHPLVEFRRRRKSARLLAGRLGLHLDEEPYGLYDFLEAVGERRGKEDGRPPSLKLRTAGSEALAKDARCRVCYGMRLGRAARRAAELGAEAFTTTLLVSRHQDREAIIEAGEAAAREHGVAFESPDLRDLQGGDLARPRDLKLYKQSYCGCVFSEEERFRETSRGE